MIHFDIRFIDESGEDYAIHESQTAYNAVLLIEKWVLTGDNTVFSTTFL